MSDFEFLSVLVSIVIGLGVTHLLRGLSRAYHFRNVNKMDAVHVAWTGTVFFALVLNWWVFLLWRDFDAWTFTTFFVVVLWTTSLYLLAPALYPHRESQDIDYRLSFVANRTWFLSIWAVMCVLDLVVTTIRDQALPETYYFLFVAHLGAIALLGIFIRNRKYDLFAAWYILLAMASWSFGVRHTLF